MTKESVEERLQRLEHELERLHAINDIQNLMSKYEYWFTAGVGTEIAKNFAEKTLGVKAVDVNWHEWSGTEEARKFYNSPIHSRVPGKPRLGQMSIHTISTPVIEVAADGKTAKGLWLSPGFETPLVKGELKAHWAWCKYGCDFVKEDGRWKFWRIHIYPLFRCPYERSWVDEPQGSPAQRFPEELKPGSPSTYWEYSTTGEPENTPAPPEPYETWDEESMV